MHYRVTEKVGRKREREGREKNKLETEVKVSKIKREKKFPSKFLYERSAKIRVGS